jgi:hypothetical protein
MELDNLFEQKNDVAKAVLEELEKVTPLTYFFLFHLLLTTEYHGTSLHVFLSFCHTSQQFV